MKKDGVLPDEFTYTTVLYFIGKKQQTQQFLELFEEMKANKIQPNQMTFMILISYFAQLSDLEQVMKYTAEMRQSGITFPDEKVRWMDLFF